MIINGDRSKYNERYQELVASELTDEEAARIAGKEWLNELWTEFFLNALVEKIQN